MKTKLQDPAAAPGALPPPAARIFGVGNAGVGLLDAISGAEFSGASFVAVNTDGPSLAACSAAVKIHLETRLLRGLGTGGDPERGRALAEEQFATLQDACEGAGLVFIIAGLGGGAGSGICPVLARAAKEAGALVLAFVTLPFWCEGNRRQSQARHSLEQLKAAADGVICLPNQKAFKLIDENTGVLDTFHLTGGFLVEGLRGLWRLLTRPGLIQVHFDDVRALLCGRHAESAFACVEAAGPARSRETVEKLLKHPLLDDGRALAESDTVLVSLLGGKDLTMAEVNRVMEQIGRQCGRAQIVMGAAVDPGMKNRLSVTVMAATQAVAGNPAVAPESNPPAPVMGPETPVPSRRRRAPGLPADQPLVSGSRGPLAAPHAAGRGRRDKAKMLQAQLPLAIVSKGRFDKSEPTIHKGEDLDIPTFIRRGVLLN
ncbi:MAG: hypothetical protein KGJ60_05040 [Verrucomicrobiota bacterium]|nr:hypothetical protein [Verrucomicrobiota bacterium]